MVLFYRWKRIGEFLIYSVRRCYFTIRFLWELTTPVFIEHITLFERFLVPCLGAKIWSVSQEGVDSIFYRPGLRHKLLTV